MDSQHDCQVAQCINCQAKAHPDLLQVIQPEDMLVGSQIDADAAAV